MLMIEWVLILCDCWPKLAPDSLGIGKKKKTEQNIDACNNQHLVVCIKHSYLELVQRDGAPGDAFTLFAVAESFAVPLVLVTGSGSTGEAFLVWHEPSAPQRREPLALLHWATACFCAMTSEDVARLAGLVDVPRALLAVAFPTEAADDKVFYFVRFVFYCVENYSVASLLGATTRGARIVTETIGARCQTAGRAGVERRDNRVDNGREQHR
jgi:hypothetical protein